ncbi:MAG: hypothetical protein ACFB20_06120 [Opitutales bacterium]
MIGWCLSQPDYHFDAHLRWGAAAGKPVCKTLETASFDYVFLREHDLNVQLAFDVFAEEFDYVAEDLRGITEPVVAEGAVLLP